MYHTIVSKLLSSAFAGLNAGRIDEVVSKFADDAEHHFIGSHSLGGLRTNRHSIQRWYERLFALFPDIQFRIRRIEVVGGPWKTLATLEWSETNTVPTTCAHRTTGST